MLITNMTIEHLDDILELENLSFSIPWSKNMFLDEFNNENALYFVAIIDGKAVGYSGMWIVMDEGNITNIAVHPEYRRAKVASKLLDALILTSKERCLTALTLEVRSGNTAAINLYSAFGFTQEGIRKKYYTDNMEDALILWKKF